MSEIYIKQYLFFYCSIELSYR